MAKLRFWRGGSSRPESTKTPQAAHASPPPSPPLPLPPSLPLSPPPSPPLPLPAPIDVGVGSKKVAVATYAWRAGEGMVAVDGGYLAFPAGL